MTRLPAQIAWSATALSHPTDHHDYDQPSAHGDDHDFRMTETDGQNYTENQVDEPIPRALINAVQDTAVQDVTVAPEQHWQGLGNNSADHGSAPTYTDGTGTPS